jgi:predicted RNA-binding protein YlqC (UPF0109 family)
MNEKRAILQEFRSFIADCVVVEPGEFEVSAREVGGTIVFTMTANPSDVARIVGREGAMITALVALARFLLPDCGVIFERVVDNGRPPVKQTVCFESKQEELDALTAKFVRCLRMLFGRTEIELATHAGETTLIQATVDTDASMRSLKMMNRHLNTVFTSLGARRAIHVYVAIDSFRSRRSEAGDAVPRSGVGGGNDLLCPEREQRAPSVDGGHAEQPGTRGMPVSRLPHAPGEGTGTRSGTRR